MTSRFELWKNLNRAMMPLAHWYALIDKSSHTRTSNQSHTRSTVQQILPYQMGTHA